MCEYMWNLFENLGGELVLAELLSDDTCVSVNADDLRMREG